LHRTLYHVVKSSAFRQAIYDLKKLSYNPQMPYLPRFLSSHGAWNHSRHARNPELLADNPAAAQRYLRMVAAVGGVPDVGDAVDDLVLEALQDAFGENGAGVPVVGRGRS
jgi:hypothetical protein